MEKPLWMWISFSALILFLLALDLGVFNRNSKNITIQKSIKLSLFYFSTGILFGIWIWYEMGIESFKEYLTGFLIEKSLSLDNIFVISMIFSYFAIPAQYQYRILFWGVLGVIILRGIMIAIGATLIANFSWIMYLFGAFLVFSGIKMLIIKEHSMNLDNNIIINLAKKYLPFTNEIKGEHFIIEKNINGNKRKFITPLMLALFVIEFVDLIFAIDSIPAIFAITNDVYIVYTCNIFAILGLRALYFALADMIERFCYLKPALALILIFIGSKIFLVNIIGKIPSVISLSVTIVLLTGGVLLSLFKTKNKLKN
jgi:tellurite resistance protein TerC